MNELDHKAFQDAAKEWQTKSAGKDLGEYFFEAGLECARGPQTPVSYRYRIGNPWGDEVWVNELPRSDTKVLETQGLYAGPLANGQMLKDAHRYQWLFGARTHAECTDEEVGLLPLKPQDYVLGKISTNYMCREAVDSLIDEAIKQTRPVQQYYYRVNSCMASKSRDPECICWHDVGTGPLINDPDAQKSFRDKPRPASPAQSVQDATVNKQLLDVAARALECLRYPSSISPESVGKAISDLNAAIAAAEAEKNKGGA